jgi:hypothetical protein
MEPRTAINQQAVDQYTMAHFAFGFIMRRMGFPLLTIVIVGVGFEVFEDRLKSIAPSVFPYASFDTKRNALVDAGATILGGILSEYDL